jgi:hypothetical protein
MMSAEQGRDRLPFRLRKQFLSFTELSLYSALREMAGERYVICPKVALNDIFYIQRPNENVHFYNKIFRKHVDFLLCEPGSMKPIFGVELVKPVAKDETRSADQYMQDLFQSAGLPLVHIRSSEKYDLSDLVNLFQIALYKSKETESNFEDEATDSAPSCPECGLVMVLRIQHKGPMAGKRYYGCMNAPTCKGAIAID